MTARRTLLRAGAAATLGIAVGAATSGQASALPSVARTAGGPDRDALRAALDQIVATGSTAALARVQGPWGSSVRGQRREPMLGKSRPASAAGRFRVGSITKTFVATVVLQLVAEGRLGLDDPVEQWLPGTVPERRAGSRVRQLLQPHQRHLQLHRRPAASHGGVPGRPVPHLTPRQQLVAVAAGRAADFAPGTYWSYSNTNYILAALIIEQVTGRTYARGRSERILRPLGLRQHVVPGPVLDIAGPHAHGYLPIGGTAGVRWTSPR